MTCMCGRDSILLIFLQLLFPYCFTEPKHFSSLTRPERRLRPASRPILAYTLIGLKLRCVITPTAVRDKEPSTTAALTHRNARGLKCFEAYFRRLTYQYTSRHSQ